MSKINKDSPFIFFLSFMLQGTKAEKNWKYSPYLAHKPGFKF